MRLAIAGLAAFVAACGGDPNPPTGAALSNAAGIERCNAVPNDGSWSLLEQQQWQALSHDFTSNFLESERGHHTNPFDEDSATVRRFLAVAPSLTEWRWL